MGWISFEVCHVSLPPDEAGIRHERWQVIKNQSYGKTEWASPMYATKQEAEAEAARLKELND